MHISLPDEVKCIIEMLETAGFEAYAVGGCVRDSLLGITPSDWDICTSALPEQTIKVFAGHSIIKTASQYGTVTLMLNRKPFEITTYRVDGKYKDNRRPDSVRFVNVLKRDLARRDFSCNAMAYNPKTGLVDYYGGQQDVAERKIKCVGNPDKRFREDALRIMRALRFASVFGFSIDGDTAKAMLDNRKLLHNIAAERITVELNKLLMGDNVSELLSAHLPVLLEIIPELEQAAGFGQNNPYHCCDVLTHILKSVDAAPKDPVIRLTMLLHDIAKPKCYTQSGDGIELFCGHPQEGSDMAYRILSRLKYDNNTIKAVSQLVLYHNSEINCRQHIKRWLNKIGEERFRQLLEVKKADALAKAANACEAKLGVLDHLSASLDEILAQRQCFSLKDLALNGRDLIAAGAGEGVEIGIILNRLMNMVIDEEAENNKTALLDIAREMIISSKAPKHPGHCSKNSR